METYIEKINKKKCAKEDNKKRNYFLQEKVHFCNY